MSTPPPADWIAPSLAEFELLADSALSALPDPFRDAAREIAIRIEDFAPDHILTEMKLDDPFELTGLYDGVPLTEKSTAAQSLQPDTIWLFRRPILDEWAVWTSILTLASLAFLA